MTPGEIAKGLSPWERRAFLTISKADWHRRPFRAEQAGGRARDFARIAKCRKMALVEHRINLGAEYRLTPLGLAVRAELLRQEEGRDA